MNIYLPIAEMSAHVMVFLGMGGAVGFLSGLFGVGGGFLMTPLLIFSGVPAAVAVGTEGAQIASSRVAVDKARTAAIFIRPSREMEEQVSAGRIGALALHGASCLTGGIPLQVGGEVGGAIVTSGGTPDEDGDRLDEVVQADNHQTLQGVVVVIIACTIVGAYLWGLDQVIRPVVDRGLL